MTALHPNQQATALVASAGSSVRLARAAGSRLVAAVRARFEQDLPGRRAVLGSAVVAFASASFAVVLALLGFGWAALPVAVLALGILAGAYFPAVYAARLDAARAAQEAAEAAA
jgi:MFS family permease